MKLRHVKLVGIIVLLLMVTFFSARILDSTITIKSKGKAWATQNGSVIHYGCDNTDNVTCTITIEHEPDN